MTELTPESMKALADKAIDETVVPKKIPDLDDEEAQKNALAGALASAYLTATDEPLGMLQPLIGKIVKQLVAYGIRQTDRIDLDAAYAPAWVTDGVRQQAMEVPEQPAHTEMDPPDDRVAVAPKMPKRMTQAARAVKR